MPRRRARRCMRLRPSQDRKSTRLNSSHLVISYAVFCLKKKKKAACRKAETRPTFQDTPHRDCSRRVTSNQCDGRRVLGSTLVLNALSAPHELIHTYHT